MKGNGIWNEKMGNEMDKSYPFIEKLSKEENYKKPPPPSPEHPTFENHNSTPNQLKHPGKQSLFFNLLKLDNFYELVKG
uniref:Uncharacterized protein n=1 Tax=Globodera pallida TaxID=36090 RepID=A0A183CKK0_GLOPA